MKPIRKFTSTITISMEFLIVLQIWYGYVVHGAFGVHWRLKIH